MLYFGDLHIHIGWAGGRPVKITASRKLTLHQIIFHDAEIKGLDIVGIVDAGSPLVLSEIEDMLARGELEEHSRGGFIAKNGVMLITGCEVETEEGAHVVIYLPYRESLYHYQKYMQTRMKNLNLSTQKCTANLAELIDLSLLLSGFLCPAHAFTPHKGIYGMVTDRIYNLLREDIKQIKALELGLSADTEMADMIEETHRFVFLSNSDAHSSANVGREYNLFAMRGLNFSELYMCLEEKEGRRIKANYGMDPRLGKYHRSFCPDCKKIADAPPPVLKCPSCGGEKNLVKGVWDRIQEIKDYDIPHHPVGRPPYKYRVPLKELPAIGKKTVEKLLSFYGSEIEIMEKASIDDIARVAGERVAEVVRKMREGKLNILPGGGGYYGKVAPDNNDD
ncbi:TIGR00375 family protein [Thermosyntropha lipolytica DSM 11003]|uniref:TIGR00375 family protein n=1 Tax=Thermosyntropha lipolytica DSM 11003 TaxID=1123382 RepID=A0A1M5J8N6_9FIRM|nr:endonuclease Q family protein [Thermosyntropha lipolytica]SHG36590.1 TIGR00375 family protein [Thermosyntropha lipolytica DSM 11003]